MGCSNLQALACKTETDRFAHLQHAEREGNREDIPHFYILVDRRGTYLFLGSDMIFDVITSDHQDQRKSSGGLEQFYQLNLETDGE